MKPIKRIVRDFFPHRLTDAVYRLWKARLVPGPLTYNQDGLATIHNADFMNEPRFLRAYEAGRRTGSWGGAEIHWRARVACWAAERAKDLEGDFVECGVNRGGLSRTVIEYVDFPKLDKRFWLLDTFEGLSEQYISEEERAAGIREGGYEPCYEAVVETFAPFDVRIIRGTVPDTLPQVEAGQVSYLSIDMNCVEPEIAAVEHFWPKMPSGAVALLDDYGWPHHEAQKRAFDELAARFGVPLLPLPTGQAILVKP